MRKLLDHRRATRDDGRSIGRSENSFNMSNRPSNYLGNRKGFERKRSNTIDSINSSGQSIKKAKTPQKGELELEDLDMSNNS